MGQTESTGERMFSSHHGDYSCVVRQDVVRRLRHQLASGAYDPPVEELVDRLVTMILSRQTARRGEIGE